MSIYTIFVCAKCTSQKKWIFTIYLSKQLNSALSYYYFHNKVFFLKLLQDNVSWVLSYSVLTVVLAAGLVLFFIGFRKYRKESNLLGSPFTTVAQVFVAAAWKWRVNNRRCWDDDAVYYGDDEDHENSGVHFKHKTLARTQQFR